MLNVTVIAEPPNLTLALEGELDLGTGSILKKVLERADLSKAESITFVLDGLKFIDSTGIGQLIGYYRQFAKENLPVHIHNQNDDIEEILELIGVREIMKP